MRSSKTAGTLTLAFSATVWRNAICGAPVNVATVNPVSVAENATNEG